MSVGSFLGVRWKEVNYGTASPLFFFSVRPGSCDRSTRLSRLGAVEFPPGLVLHTEGALIGCLCALCYTVVEKLVVAVVD